MINEGEKWRRQANIIPAAKMKRQGRVRLKLSTLSAFVAGKWYKIIMRFRESSIHAIYAQFSDKWRALGCLNFRRGQRDPGRGITQPVVFTF